jgi:ubiquinone/menaquinone biosynthesis C-methylase UbiE
MTDRLQREQSFHDQRFSEPEERARKVGRFYRLATSVQADYRQLLAAQTADYVLEYGCGTANYAFDLAQRGSQVLGIDISAVALQQARQSINTTQVSFSQMNAEGLAMANNTFDLVCGTGILHHLDLEAALIEIARVLRPNGRAIFIEPLGHNIFINAFRRFTPGIRSEDEHPLLMADLALLNRYFGMVETRYYYFTTLALAPFVHWKLFPSLLKTTETIDQALFRLPILQKQAWQILIQLSQPSP